MRSSIILGLALFVACGCAAAPEPQDGLKPIFDGKTLNGWRQINGTAKYRVEDGCVVGSTAERSPNSFLCTEKLYGDFILELEYKVDEGLNSGIQVRSNSFQEYRDGRVHGYQVEIDPSPRAYSAGVYDEARRGWLQDMSKNEAARKAFKQNDWNHCRIEMIGDSIKTWLNGVPAADLRDAMTMEGFIGLQVHGVKPGTPTLQVRWRNIRLKDLGHRQWVPIFDGKTLDGWEALPGGKWEVRDGAILGTAEKAEKRHGMLITKKRYGDFTVRFKFKAVKGNSGFYFRVDKVKQNVGVHGFQAEVEDAFGTGGLYETGGRGWVVQVNQEEMKKTYKPGEWSDMWVSAHGKRLVVHVNGKQTAELKDDPGRLEGHIALQLHGGQDMEVWYKDIQILGDAK